MSSERLHITTVDQHVGNHKPTGMRETCFVEVRTDLSDYVPTVDFEKQTPDDQRLTLEILAEIHEANVALAELDADHRAAAQEWLADYGTTDFDGVAPMIRKAIRETSDENTIGARLYRARTLAGISQSELAKAIGTSKAGVSIVEKNQRVPTLDWLIRAARALNVSGAVLSDDLADRIPPANPKS
jgi:DNA-binding XRE family transcriptional regulator